ncbi:hypothetical protein [uncultured Roseobacter sp.]|uniref:hypothetical protein n=1 Tax=uncultured Roseobacter sp. TaxID=114847 RepID=UPI002628FC65|nr:hypothetical protein [uncultured Roseobacter sp.]
MTNPKKSYHLDIQISDPLNRERIMPLVEQAAAATGLYISHIGGYSRVKYPNSVHWHFKRDKSEPGLIDATFWQEGAAFWLIVRHAEPQWVHDTAPALQNALQRAVTAAEPAGPQTAP